MIPKNTHRPLVRRLSNVNALNGCQETGLLIGIPCIHLHYKLTMESRNLNISSIMACNVCIIQRSKKPFKEKILI